MRYSWTVETYGYALRDGRGFPFAVLTSPGPREGFYSHILEADLPASGPYKTRKEAADWAAGMLVRHGTAAADSEFGDVPD